MGIGNVSAAMGAAVAAVLLNPFHNRISIWAERRFQRDLVLLKSEVREIVGNPSGGSSTQLGRTVLSRIDQAVHATRSAILLDATVVAASGVDLAAIRR